MDTLLRGTPYEFLVKLGTMKSEIAIMVPRIICEIWSLVIILPHVGGFFITAARK
jgi:hypothetical protein